MSFAPLDQKSHNYSFNLIVRFIDPMVETTLCMVQDICPLGTIDLAIFEVVMLKKILIIVLCFLKVLLIQLGDVNFVSNGLNGFSVSSHKMV